ncbi:MAG: signal recognition particle-docking protein FtsY [Phycisphaeraceae bacterium]|nr:signal recognition particle-docking protein FtsY [Phycisphaeraceae bacterium]
MGLFRSTFTAIRRGLARTRDAFAGTLRTLLTGQRLSEDLIDQIERTLITGDVGVHMTGSIVTDLRASFRRGEIERGEDALEFLKRRLRESWKDADRSLARAAEKPTVILVAGVNGAGKTTSVAKIARSLREEGRTVLLAAADTFRAGAIEQLAVWAKRLNVDLVRGQPGADPAAVVFDAAEAAVARGVDVLLIDTAGRLHTQEHLMRELTKIRRVVERRIPGAPHEVLLVLDATAGQNAIEQAKIFSRAIDVTGIFLAKLDGTARGGIVLAVQQELGIPVKLVGVGERPEDVEPFDPATFVEAMFALPENAAT